ERAVARPRRPLERIVAEEEVDASAAERRASPVDPNVFRSTRVDGRVGQGLARRPRVRAELVLVLGRCEKAHQPDAKPPCRRARPELALAPAPPGGHERGPEAAAQPTRTSMKPRYFRLCRARLPAPGRRVAVDLEELPAPVQRPRPVEAREQPP